MPPRTKAGHARHRARLRLAAQGLTGDKLWPDAHSVVRDFGLMQAQEYSSVVRSVTMRAESVADLPSLVRGYPMRGTVFLGCREDMGWITELCAKVKERPHTRVALEVYEAMEGKALSRAEFKTLALPVIQSSGLDTSVYSVIKHLMERGLMYYAGANQDITPLELPTLEQTFNGDRVAAATELAGRYFRSRGPATVQDFRWWSKLPVALIKHAMENLPEDVITTPSELGETGGPSDGELYYHREGLVPVKRSVHLLSPFDEYILGYQDRLFAMDAVTHTALVPKNMGIFRKSIVVDGQVRGIWTSAGVEDLGIPAYAQAKVARHYAAAHQRGS